MLLLLLLLLLFLHTAVCLIMLADDTLFLRSDRVWRLLLLVRWTDNGNAVWLRFLGSVETYLRSLLRLILVPIVLHVILPHKSFFLFCC